MMGWFAGGGAKRRVCEAVLVPRVYALLKIRPIISLLNSQSTARAQHTRKCEFSQTNGVLRGQTIGAHAAQLRTRLFSCMGVMASDLCTRPTFKPFRALECIEELCR